MRRNRNQKSTSDKRKHPLILLLLSIGSLLVLASCFCMSGCNSSPSGDGQSTTGQMENSPGYSYYTGRAIWTDQGCYLVMNEEYQLKSRGNLMKIRPQNESVDFSSIQNGDLVSIKILILLDSDPLQTEVYEFQILDRGHIDNVPAASVSELEELGYVIKE